ncbi:Integral membrane protein OS=Tsukamurella paurometabola (strain ATCC 8368 / DSM / CCUG 35730/ CIP 100753 / JCM 10117 / KCTC 9821 / NBRC 16120 / NCIMB 702349/ NCTC 13040) OX=521096 GN=Tpau_4025 PE=4 SV=1 [Tsukamurella paurometabola]|uniref:DUF6545 domain-containing protein n=1 Tax=Tsukamurella paurometabola (strain ATCC 8368 / DSM 20162 / CCUG 35730 / CIP 100753 / JCM 10117 / KCTC 9821 / NBRC 16120 / NCIMB 702349 / NCTC 13040) TaxID=521096 RepID=D5UNA1_TSUPD|nr:MAB_1171c family putative transporter [Tsukamurella paurometabola]ADG80596.1 hypothetical protein Tpau_4025 [Tsukamurella paurometabola DSM 20162]SUP40224.1 Uncharacterised protein [Tsukamurella paurometabola]
MPPPHTVVVLNDVLFSGASLACALVAVLIAATCLKPGRAAQVRRWLALSFGLKALGFASAAPWIVRRVNAVFADSASLLITYSISPLWCASMILVARSWRLGSVSRAFGFTVGGAAIGSTVAMIVLWWHTPRTDLVGSVSAKLAETATGTALILTYAGSLSIGLIVLLGACRFHTDRLGEVATREVRTAVAIISAGVALDLVFAANQAAKALSSAHGTPLVALEYVTAPSAILAAVLLGAGFAYPEARHRWRDAARDARARRTCRALTPLWTDLNTTRGAEPTPWLAAAHPEIRVYRMMVDIHDGLIHLAPLLPGVGERSHPQSSAEFAREIRGAVLQMHKSDSPTEGQYGFGEIARRPDLPFDQQISWVSSVSREYRSLTDRKQT